MRVTPPCVRVLSAVGIEPLTADVFPERCPRCGGPDPEGDCLDRETGELVCDPYDYRCGLCGRTAETCTCYDDEGDCETPVCPI